MNTGITFRYNVKRNFDESGTSMRQTAVSGGRGTFQCWLQRKEERTFRTWQLKALCCVYFLLAQ